MKKSRKYEVGNGKYRIRIVFLYFLLLTFYFSLLTSLSLAEDTIKVLIIENPNAPLPAGKSEKVGHLKGEIFINDYRYKGYIEVIKNENGLYFINELPFENYIEGVVAAEIGEDWALEALKAQAVIARTYAIYQKTLNKGKTYHITSSVLHQVYKGSNKNEIITKAVNKTSGEILTYNDKPIEAFYHSTCIGKTELPDVVWEKNYPYIKSVPCRGEHSPYEHWQRRFRLDEIEKAIGLNGIKDILIASYTSTRRVELLKVVTEDSEKDIRAVDLRKLLGYKELPSTDFNITKKGKNIIFEGRGYGHGVGLSQWGALELANEGKDYKEILEHYYPGTVLRKMENLKIKMQN